MPRAASAVRAGEDGREGEMSMAVCAKMVSGDLRFGPKIHIAFPRNFSNRLVMDIMDEINDFLAERLGGGEAGQIQERAGAHCTACSEPHGGHDSRQEVKENTLHRPAPVMLHEKAAMKRAAHDIRFASSDDGGGSVASASSLKAWPESGFVTVNDIVGYWNIGTSSFRNRVRSGVFSRAVECPDRSPNAPKVWDAAVIGRELAANGYVRRGL